MTQARETANPAPADRRRVGVTAALTGKRGKALSGQEPDATQQTQTQPTVEKAPVAHAGPEHSAASPAPAITAAAMIASQIATTPR